MFAINIKTIDIILFIMGYLLGTIPVGMVIARFLNIDITKKGSGNIGATNITRVIGPKWGKVVFIIDFLKAIIFTLLFQFILNIDFNYFVYLSILIGNVFNVFLGMKGGKGVTVFLSILFVTNIQIYFVCWISWLVIYFYFGRTVSLASLLMFIPGIVFLAITSNYSYLIFLTIMFAIVLLKHKENIIRLINGTEKSFKK